MINLLDLDAAGLAALLRRPGREAVSREAGVALGAPAPRRRRRRDDRPVEAAARALAADRRDPRPAVVRDTTAADGTRKWLLDVGAGNAVETVYIPEDDRGTLCISSQAGCALDCAFCSTGKQGFNRNLTTAEIVGQLWHANRALLADGVSAPVGRAGPRADHQRRDDGHGRAARQLRQRRAARCG